MTDKHIQITPKAGRFSLGELWCYRDLIRLLTRRNLLVSYKQTVLGPAWLFLQPLCSALVYAAVFGGVAGIGTDGVPGLLFYLTGTAVWTFFSACVTKNALCFRENASLMGKVWFPRLAVPISNVLCAACSLGMQLILVAVLLLAYAAGGAVFPRWGEAVVLLPAAALQLGLLGLGTGLILSAVTVTYRDLHVLVGFGMQLWMYGSPIVYPVSETSGWMGAVLAWNPVTAPVELLRLCLLGKGTVDLRSLGWSAAVTVLVSFLGVRAFSRAETNFVDRV